MSYTIITADYSQVELRIAGYVSQEPKFLDAYNNDKDIHRKTASLIFKIPEEKVTKDQRSTGKNTNFAMLYESGAWNLSRKFKIPIKDAENIRLGFREGYPTLTLWKEQYGLDALSKGYAETLLGRKRYFTIPTLYDPDFEKTISEIKREAVNHRIQGTSADIIKIAMIKIDAQISNFGRILLTVHDEIVSEVLDEYTEIGVGIIGNSMLDAFYEIVPGIKCAVDVASGKCWSK